MKSLLTLLGFGRRPRSVVNKDGSIDKAVRNKLHKQGIWVDSCGRQIRVEEMSSQMLLGIVVYLARRAMVHVAHGMTFWYAIDLEPFFGPLCMELGRRDLLTQAGKRMAHVQLTPSELLCLDEFEPEIKEEEAHEDTDWLVE